MLMQKLCAILQNHRIGTAFIMNKRKWDSRLRGNDKLYFGIYKIQQGFKTDIWLNDPIVVSTA
jgi:hypothetical protein